MTVVLAAPGYPEAAQTGGVITSADAEPTEGEGSAYVLHAGTTIGDDGLLRAAGGRVPSIVGSGADLAEAGRRHTPSSTRSTSRGSTARTSARRPNTAPSSSRRWGA